MTALMLVDAEVDGVPGIDIRLDGDAITAVGRNLDRRGVDACIDLGGGAVIPGLHDHHVHLRALAARAASVVVGPPEVTDAAGFATRLRDVAATQPGEWLRAVGYHESVAGDLDAASLDAVVPTRPLRVQHRSGAMWILNTEALRRIGAERSRPDGRLWRMDDELRKAIPSVALDMAAVGRAAATRGITGFTDADPERTVADLAPLAALPQRVHVMGPVGLAVDGHQRLTLGPVKVILDDDTLPGPDELVAVITAAHAEARPAAVHCVTAAQLVLTLAAFDAAGTRPGDRLEHAALMAGDLIPDIARMGLTVVTQPNFVRERGDAYVADLDHRELPDLYRCRSFIDAGIPTAAGTDAPFGHPDPWAAMAAAVDRTLGADERVTATTALGLFLGHATAPGTPRRVATGESADLCLLHCPLADALGAPHADLARATIVAGELVSGG